MKNTMTLKPNCFRNYLCKFLIIQAVIFIVLLFLFFCGKLNFASFIVQNASHKPIDIVGIKSEYSLIFKSKTMLNHYQATGFWGVFFNKKISIEIVLKNLSHEEFSCTVDLQGSDSCAIEILEKSINCDCFQ